MHVPTSFDALRPMIFVRHGATKPNQAGLRCGGDLDVPLTALGRRQAVEAGRRIRGLQTPVGIIVSSDLIRTRTTARLISRQLHRLEVVIEPGLAERRLGAWNLRPIDDTEDALAQGQTPPGGESEQAFSERIAAAVQALLPRLGQRALLVGSKGVARVLGQLLGQPGQPGQPGPPGQPGIANGEVVHFDLAAFARRATRGSNS